MSERKQAKHNLPTGVWLRDGHLVYRLNEMGRNRKTIRIEGGRDEDDKPIPEPETDDLARRVHALLQVSGGIPTAQLEAAGLGAVAKLVEALREIGEYTGEGPHTTPWQQIVRDCGKKARAALAPFTPAAERKEPAR